MPEDVDHILRFINELAEYEKLTDQVVITREDLLAQLFRDHSPVEAFMGELDGKPVGYALFFYNLFHFFGKARHLHRRHFRSKRPFGEAGWERLCFPISSIWQGKGDAAGWNGPC